MTTKGEAVAVGIAQMSTAQISITNHGVAARIKRVVMERDTYPRQWGLGPVATEKKLLKASGKLDKFGRTNEQTPGEWTAKYKDFSGAAQNASDQSAVGNGPAAIASDAAASSEAKAPPEQDFSTGIAQTNGDENYKSTMGQSESQSSKKRKHEETPDQREERKKSRHENETPEERAERKKAKHEKKAAKEEKRARKVASAAD